MRVGEVQDKWRDKAARVQRRTKLEVGGETRDLGTFVRRIRRDRCGEASRVTPRIPRLST